MTLNNIISSQPNRLESSPGLIRLAGLVIVSKVIFLMVAWLLPILSPFTLLGDNISELAIGRYGYIQTIAFVISGFGTIGFAYAIKKLTVKSKKSFIGSLLIAIYGIGAILSAFFPTDRIDNPADLETLSATGTIHVLVALVSFLCVITGMFTLTWAFRKGARWKRHIRLPVILFPCAAFSLIFVQSQGPLGGLMQRILVTVISGWLIFIAVKIRKIAMAENRPSSPGLLHPELISRLPNQNLTVPHCFKYSNNPLTS